MKKLILVASAVLGLAAPVLACPGHEDSSKTADDKSAPATPKKTETSTTAKAAPTPAPAPTNTKDQSQTKKPDKVSSR
jgi:hypothetical protein